MTEPEVIGKPHAKEEIEGQFENLDSIYGFLSEICDNYIRDMKSVDPNKKLGCNGDRFELYPDGISAFWTSSWSYGGYDEGWTRVPWAYITDPEGHIKALKNEIEAAKTTKKKVDAKAKRKKDLETLAKLKEQYPDEAD